MTDSQSAKTSAKERAVSIARGQPAAQVRPLASNSKESWRETVESIVFAFMLAFLFRTFLMEAFVIPTGSMAETLYGRHKDIVCEQCGTRFRVGASEEVDRDHGLYRRGGRVQFGFCPNCRFGNNIFASPVFKGDRILVNKFPFEFSTPQPWDVVVFKFPDDPKTNYIKRLIGLPNETITLEWGDVHRQVGTHGALEIRRKPPSKQREMQMLVHDNDRPARALLEQGWPESWEPGSVSAGKWAPDTAGWSADAQSRTFQIDAAPSDQELHWVRFQNFVPGSSDWERALEKLPLMVKPEPLLVSDYCAYNSGYTMNSPISSPQGDMLGEHWVGDLTVGCEVEVLTSQGKLVMELVESLRRYRCAVDLTTGKATLYYQDEKLVDAAGNYENVELGEAATPLSKPGKYRLSFANVDDRLCLWVDDRLIPFPNEGNYEFSSRTAYRLPTEKDLCPIGIASQGAKLRVAHLLVERDIYYTNKDDENGDWRVRLSNPSLYGDYAARIRPDVYPLAADEYFMLGDNSPRSSDSRHWDSRPVHPYAVPQELLIGKAFFIYWPHGIPFGNNGQGYALINHKIWDNDKRHAVEPTKEEDKYPEFSIPFYPQFGRMQRIR